MTQPGIRKSLEAPQALCVSVIYIFAEHSFRNNCNTQCSNSLVPSPTPSFPLLAVR